MTWKVYFEHFYYISKSYGPRKNSVCSELPSFSWKTTVLERMNEQKDLYNLVKQCITL